MEGITNDDAVVVRMTLRKSDLMCATFRLRGEVCIYMSDELSFTMSSTMAIARVDWNIIAASP